MKDPLTAISLSATGGTVVAIGFLAFMAVTGDFSCGRTYVDGYQVTMKCSYNGHSFAVPLAPGTTPGTARKY